MKAFRAVACVALLAPAGRAIHAQAPASLTARMDAYLGPFASTANISGVVLVARGSRILYQRAFGLAEPAFGVPNSPATRFHVASISKAYTAAAILLLEDRGLLRTTDPVSRFLPGYRDGDRITLDHLLRHTSGLPDAGPFPDSGEGYRPYDAERVVATFRSRPLEFEPGTRPRYTNADYNLLALVIETATGRSYGDFLAQDVLRPLGLAHTLHDGDARRVVPRLALGTEPDGLTGVRYVPYQAWSTKIGSGSMVTTAGDLCAFASALFGSRWLSPAARDKLLHADGVFPYGWTDRERAGRPVKASGGRSPGFIGNVEYFLDDGTCVAILTNSYSSVGQVVAGDVSTIAAGRAVAPPRIRRVRPRHGQLAAFAGRFQLPDSYYLPGATLTIRDAGEYLAAEWSAGFTSVIHGTGGDDFVDRTNWAMVHFTRDAGGDVNGFRYRLLQDFTARRLTP